MKLDDTDPLAPKLKAVMFIVRATDFEYQCLREQYRHKVHWEDAGGYTLPIGTLAGRNVQMALTWAFINNEKVMFVQTTSEVGDRKMVDAWLAANCAPREFGSGRMAITNPSNFGECLSEIKRRNNILFKHGA